MPTSVLLSTIWTCPSKLRADHRFGWPFGGGKSTTCSLLPRFYDVAAGSISIDGQDVRDVTQQSLRRAIGLVQQDVYLFDGTIGENIAYGKPGATAEEIAEAAHRANIDALYRVKPSTGL